MPYSATENERDVAYKIVAVLTVRLHTGNPGADGTANRTIAMATPEPEIPAGAAGWTIAANSAENTAAVDFGAASAAIAGISWYSLWRAGVFIGRRALAAAMDVANGSNVSLAAASIVLTETSVD